jgi:hypothetical protein
MSKKPADKSIDEQTFEALEDALKIDLNDDGLGVLDDVSLDELETRSPTRPRNSRARSRQRPPRSRQSAGRTALRPRRPPRLSRRQARWRRPMTTAARTPPACCARLKSARAAARSATPPSSRCFGPIGVLGLANLLYGPAIWQIRSVSRICWQCPRQSALPGRDHRSDPRLLRLFDHDGARPRNALRCPFDGRSGPAPGRAGKHCRRPHSHRRPGRSPRSLGHERRHRAHHCPRFRTRDAGSFRSQRARAQLFRQ